MSHNGLAFKPVGLQWFANRLEIFVVQQVCCYPNVKFYAFYKFCLILRIQAFSAKECLIANMCKLFLA